VKRQYGGSAESELVCRFMDNALVCGRHFRTLNVVDGFNHEALSIEIDLNLPAPRVGRVLDRIAANRG